MRGIALEMITLDSTLLAAVIEILELCPDCSSLLKFRLPFASLRHANG